MKTLSEKTNRININEKIGGLMRIIDGSGRILTPKTVQFFANEKNGDLSPMAEKTLIWAKENGFEMVSRPARKAKVNKNEYYRGKRQDVIWQWTKYTIK